MAKLLTQVSISGVIVADNTISGPSGTLIKWVLKKDYGNPISLAKLEFSKKLNDVVKVATSQELIISGGFASNTDDTLFKGYVQTYEPEAGKLIIKGVDKLYDAVRNTVNAKIYDSSVVGNAIYPDGKVSDAFKDIVTTHAGLNADSSTIQDTGSVITLSKFICDHTDPKERLDRLAEAMNWVYFYNSSTDKVYFQPKGFTTNSNSLTVGSNIVKVPKWKIDKDDLINDLRVDGAFQQQELSDLFTGDGTETAFSLSATPVGDIAVYSSAENYATTSPIQGDLQVLGVSGSSTTFDYAVDKSTKKITFDGGSIPSANTNNVLAKYVGVVAVPVHYDSPTSKEKYKFHGRTIQLTDVISVADAENRTINVVDRFSEPFKSTKLSVPTVSGVSYSIGESVFVDDSVNNPAISGTFTIWGTETDYPSSTDVIKIGDRDFESPEFYINQSERLHRLERELISEGTVLTELFRTEYSLEVKPSQLVITQEFINDSFILDHAVNSIMYDSDETIILNDFEDATDWKEDTGSISLTETIDNNTNHFWIGSQGLNYQWTDTSGTAIIFNSGAVGDVTGVTGAGVTKGTMGVWVYVSGANYISGVSARIGTNSSNYAEYIGQTYAQRQSLDSFFNVPINRRTLVLFDASSADAVLGIPNPFNINFIQFRISVSGASSVTFDYNTISTSNDLSLNGLGERFTTKLEETTNY